MLWVNRITALALLAAAVPLWQMADRFPGTATIFPRLTLATIAFLALIMLGRTFVPAIANPSDGEGERNLRSMVLPIATFIVGLVSLVIMRMYGFFPAALFIGIALFFILPVDRKILYVTLFACLMVFVYVVFSYFLRVALI